MAAALSVSSGIGLIAQAQSFSYATRDLLLTFHRSGSADMEVNLGSIDSFKSLALGSTVNLSSKYDITTQLDATFGNLNSLSLSVIGTQRGAGSQAANTSWMTLARSNPSVPSDAPFGYTASKTQSIQSQISGIAGDGSSSGALQYAGSHPENAVSNHGSVVIIPTTGTDSINSYSVKAGSAGGLDSLIASPGVDNTTRSDFSSVVGNFIRSDLYEYTPGSAGNRATWVGTFEFSNNGVTTFTAIPEPTTTALLILGGLSIGVAKLRRKNS